MADTQQNEGYNLIQCSEISSTSDVLKLNHVYPFFYLPRGRRTYQRRSYSHLMLHPPHFRPQIIPIPYRENVTSQQTFNTHFAILTVSSIFLCSLLALSFVYMNFPEVTHEERQHIRIPWNIEQAKHLGIILNQYKDDHYLQVMVGVFVTYIFVALTLVCTCSAVGASLCFLLSQLLGRRIVLKYFPERANKWAVIVNKQRDNLFNYVVFLRVTPFLPNWFINLTAPVIGVPLKPFALGTFFGVAPPSFVAIQAGQTLHTMSSTDTTFSWNSFILLGLFALISLVPIF
ncbi:hypothetical protein FQR65_LT02906 [Abscondita terminalis]|nr:hypothetical protein FQR65_LT02906 [Abscondita terminalis]